MRTWMVTATPWGWRIRTTLTSVLTLLLLLSATALAQPAGETASGEASLKLPDLSEVTFLGGINGHNLLMIGLVFCGCYVLPLIWAASVGTLAVLLSASHSIRVLLRLMPLDQIPSPIRRLIVGFGFVPSGRTKVN